MRLESCGRRLVLSSGIVFSSRRVFCERNHPIVWFCCCRKPICCGRTLRREACAGRREAQADRRKGCAGRREAQALPPRLCALPPGPCALPLGACALPRRRCVLAQPAQELARRSMALPRSSDAGALQGAPLALGRRALVRLAGSGAHWVSAGALARAVLILLRNCPASQPISNSPVIHYDQAGITYDSGYFYDGGGPLQPQPKKRMASLKLNLSKQNPAQLIALADIVIPKLAPAAPATPPIPNMAAKATALGTRKATAKTATMPTKQRWRGCPRSSRRAMPRPICCAPSTLRWARRWRASRRAIR